MISIHRIVLRRMFAAWLLASLLIGSIANFIEMEKVGSGTGPVAEQSGRISRFF